MKYRNDFQKLVLCSTKKIPRGRVTTYAEIACLIGRPRAVRAVGNALNRNPYKSVPCHRVIRSDGSVGGFALGAKVKIKILRGEGVKILPTNKVAYSHILKNLRVSR